MKIGFICIACILVLGIIGVIIFKKIGGSEKRKLLKKIAEQRKANVQIRYRMDCQQLFDMLSRGIQEMLGQEKITYINESDLCKRLNIIAVNDSMQNSIDIKKAKQEPEALSSEIKACSTDELEKILKEEKNLYSEPMIVLPWDKIVEGLIPCLEKIMDFAENSCVEECRGCLKELKKILSDFDILIVWHNDEIVKNDEEIQDKFISNARYSVPMLYYYTGKEYVNIGKYGCIGPEN